jgi:hypothetical protein
MKEKELAIILNNSIVDYKSLIKNSPYFINGEWFHEKFAGKLGEKFSECWRETRLARLK